MEHLYAAESTGRTTALWLATLSWCILERLWEGESVITPCRATLHPPTQQVPQKSTHITTYSCHPGLSCSTAPLPQLSWKFFPAQESRAVIILFGSSRVGVFQIISWWFVGHHGYLLLGRPAHWPGIVGICSSFFPGDMSQILLWFKGACHIVGHHRGTKEHWMGEKRLSSSTGPAFPSSSVALGSSSFWILLLLH